MQVVIHDNHLILVGLWIKLNDMNLKHALTLVLIPFIINQSINHHLLNKWINETILTYNSMRQILTMLSTLENQYFQRWGSLVKFVSHCDCVCMHQFGPCNLHTAELKQDSRNNHTCHTRQPFTQNSILTSESRGLGTIPSRCHRLLSWKAINANTLLNYVAFSQAHFLHL